MLHLAVTILTMSLGQTATQSEPLRELLQPVIQGHEGEVAVAVKNLDSGEMLNIRADVPMPTASLIKISVMAEAYHQASEKKIDLSQMITLKEEDKAPGSGILTSHFSAGMQLSVRDAIRLMMAYSDNTATNLVIDQIGLKASGDYMATLGFPETKINAKVFRRDTSIALDRSVKYGLGSTTAGETVGLLEMIYQGKLGDEAMTKEMLAHLKACTDTNKITRLLPRQTVVYHKGGSVSATRTVGAIIETAKGPVAVCVLTDKNKDTRWTDENAGDMLTSRIGQVIFEHYQKDSQPAPKATLAMGATGPKVEVLQRTLNARQGDSMRIGVDGDFGEETHKAVLLFQEAKGLSTTGEIDEATVKALQPWVTGEPEVAEPEVVNTQTLPVQPADPLTGAPIVSAQAWAIADGDTGKVLWSSSDNKPRDFASVTKMMTAYIVIKLAEQDPKVLEEMVTFSERADKTVGSTAAVRAGEIVSVGELLYGLMLPSGNDASVALGEHFGGRFETSDETKSDDPLDRFIAEMNRTALLLGMTNTHYKNTHGLTAKDHLSTPEDLTKLAFAAMRMPLYRHYVGTRQRGAKLITADGFSRNVIWENTNQLLGIEGFDGVKTGTTNAAGACLCSTGVRDGRRLIVVVLGASSSQGRYIDSRNLYRWAWSQLK